MEHGERQRWVEEVARINRRLNAQVTGQEADTGGNFFKEV